MLELPLNLHSATCKKEYSNLRSYYRERTKYHTVAVLKAALIWSTAYPVIKKRKILSSGKIVVFFVFSYGVWAGHLAHVWEKRAATCRGPRRI